jgi:uncharacterized protein
VQKVFLDANVLFSAAYRKDAGLCRLWQVKGIELVTSAYAVKETAANLNTDEQQRCLAQLLEKIIIIPHFAKPPELPSGIILPEKDKPIFQAAMKAGAAFLLTGDVAHFGRYFGKTIAGIRILLPGDFLGKTPVF